MKRNINLLIFLLLILLVGLCAILSYLNLSKEYYFKDMFDAKETIERGWIPNNIPQDSKEIFVTYQIDEANSRGYLSSNQAKSFVDGKKRLEMSDLKKLISQHLSMYEKNILTEISGDNSNYIIIDDMNCLYIVKENKIFFWLCE